MENKSGVVLVIVVSVVFLAVILVSGFRAIREVKNDIASAKESVRFHKGSHKSAVCIIDVMQKWGMNVPRDPACFLKNEVNIRVTYDSARELSLNAASGEYDDLKVRVFAESILGDLEEEAPFWVWRNRTHKRLFIWFIVSSGLIFLACLPKGAVQEFFRDL